jgi:hypothetical protein
MREGFMGMVVGGRTLATEAVLKGIQRHLKCEGDLEGDITHVIRTAYRWQEKEKGIAFHWKAVGEGYSDYRYRTGELPECVYRYFAEVVDPK